MGEANPYDIVRGDDRPATIADVRRIVREEVAAAMAGLARQLRLGRRAA